MGEIQDFTLEDFSGGLNVKDHPTKIADNQSPDAQNVFSDNPPSVKKRNGFTKVDVAIGSGNKSIVGTFNYVKSDGVEYLMAISATTLYYLNSSGVWTSTGFTGFTDSKDATFAVYKDALYIANGEERIVKAIHDSKTTPTWTVAESADTDCPRAKYIWIHKDRLFAAHDMGRSVVTVTNVARTTNVSTLTVASHSLVAGNIIYVSGITNDSNSFNGTFKVESVTATTIVYNQTASNFTSAAATGTRPWVAEYHPSGTYWSDRTDADNWTAGNNDPVAERDGDNINGATKLHDTNYIFKNNAIYRVSGDFVTVNTNDVVPTSEFSEKDAVKIGTASHRTIQYYDNNLIFLNKKGVYAFDGTREELLSENIDSLLRDRTYNVNYSKAVSWVYKDRYYLSVPCKCEIASISRTGTTVTVVTTMPHHVAVDDKVTIANTGVATLNETSRIVTSVTSPTIFVYTSATSATSSATTGLIGSETNNYLFVYDFLTESWWHHTSIHAGCFGEKDDKLYAGDSRANGFVYQLENGTADAVVLSKQVSTCDEAGWTGSTDNSTEFKQGTYSQKLAQTIFSNTNIADCSASSTFRPGSRNIVEDSSGNMYVAYCGTSPNFRLMVKKITPAGVVTGVGSTNGEVTATTWDTIIQYHPSLAILSNGDLIILWQGYKLSTDTLYTVYFSKYTSGAWTTPVNIGVPLSDGSTSSDGANYHPAITVQSDSVYHVSYSTRMTGGTRYFQYHKTTNGGATWSGNTQLYAFVGNNYVPGTQIIVDNNNYVHVGFINNYDGSLRYYRYTTSWQSLIVLAGAGTVDFSMASRGNNFVDIVYIGSDNKTYTFSSSDSGASFMGATEFNAGSGKTWQKIALTFGSKQTTGNNTDDKWQVVAQASDGKAYYCFYNVVKSAWSSWVELGAATNNGIGLKYSWNNHNNPHSMLCAYNSSGNVITIKRYSNLTSSNNANITGLTLDLSVYGAGQSSSSADIIKIWNYVTNYIGFFKARLTIKTDDSNYAYKEWTGVDIPNTDNTWTQFQAARSAFTTVGTMNWASITEIDYWTLSYNLDNSFDDIMMFGLTSFAVDAYFKTKSFDQGYPANVKRYKRAFITATKQTSQVNVDIGYELDQNGVPGNASVANASATSGSTTTIVKTGSGWTVNAYIGYVIEFSKTTNTVALRGYKAVILDNTTDTLTVGTMLAAAAASDVFSVYSLPSINTYDSDSSSLVNKKIQLTGNGKLIDLKFANDNSGEDFEIHNLVMQFKLKKAKELS